MIHNPEPMHFQGSFRGLLKGMYNLFAVSKLQYLTKSHFGAPLC